MDAQANAAYDEVPRVKVLFLAEGSAESRDSWSGISYSVVKELRLAGHDVTTRDTEVYGVSRVAAALASWTPQRKRWAMKFRLGPIPFRLRSRNAERHLARTGAPDVILQVGATFEPPGRATVPYALFCDSNILLSKRGASTEFSEASLLTSAELDGVVEREAAIYRGAAAIFTLSERTRRSFIEDFHVPPERVRAVYGGPNFDAASLALPERVGEGPPSVVFVGRQFERKGGDVLVAAFRKVRQHVADAQLTVVGPSRLEIQEPWLRFLGFLDKDKPSDWASLVSAYRSADVFCMPTRFEAFGIAYIEAMHFGLPCIGTDVWAVPEIIRNGETGYVVPPNDVDALAERLTQLLTDRALAGRMGASGRSRAQQQFTWARVAARIAETLDAVVRPQLPR